MNRPPLQTLFIVAIREEGILYPVHTGTVRSDCERIALKHLDDALPRNSVAVLRVHNYVEVATAHETPEGPELTKNTGVEED